MAKRGGEQAEVGAKRVSGDRQEQSDRDERFVIHRPDKGGGNHTADISLAGGCEDSEGNAEESSGCKQQPAVQDHDHYAKRKPHRCRPEHSDSSLRSGCCEHEV